MTHREMMGRMGSDELMEWLAYDRIEPLPDPHWSAALVSFVMARSMGSKGAKLEDFLPSRGKPRRQTPAEIASIVRGVVAAVEAQNRNR